MRHTYIPLYLLPSLFVDSFERDNLQMALERLKGGYASSMRHIRESSMQVDFQNFRVI